MKRMQLGKWLLAAGACGFVACGAPESDVDDPSAMLAALESPNGGMTADDEAPMLDELFDDLKKAFQDALLGLDAPMPVDACDRSAMAGHWHAVKEDLGVFHGRVVGRKHGIRGHIRGFFGKKANGERVFVGKLM